MVCGDSLNRTLFMDQIHGILKELEDYEKELYAASTDYRELARDAAEKRARYDVAYAVELLKLREQELKLTVPEREAMTVQTVQNQLTACRIAEALADGAKRHLGALQSNLTSLQTRASLLRTERSLVNMAV
jgi:hypothetical protein